MQLVEEAPASRGTLTDSPRGSLANGLIANDDDDDLTPKDAMQSAIALFAFILNVEGGLERYYGWLLKHGVLEEPDATGVRSGDYRAHLDQVMAYFISSYELFEMNTAGRFDPGIIDARMTPATVAPQPGKGGGKHRLRIID